MLELGYLLSPQNSSDQLSLEEISLINSSISSFEIQKEYQKICEERMQVINILDKEVKRLTSLLT